MQRLPPLLFLILAQGCALLLARFIVPLLPTQLYLHLLVQGVIAAAIGQLLRLPRWWLPINLLLPLAASIALTLQIPSWIYLLVFLLLLLVQWNSSSERVPLYLSNRKTWQALDSLLPEQNLHFIDFGSGLGGTLFYLARRHPQGHFTGIESAPLPYAVARIRLAMSGLKNVELRYGSFWHIDLSLYNVLYAFLSPIPMQKLFDKARIEMQEGSLFISNSFTVPGHPSDQVHQVDDRRHTQLHCWQLNSNSE